MFCILLTLVFSFLGGLVIGFVIAAMSTIPAVFSFFNNNIPIAKFATIETFFEAGLIINFLLNWIFRKRNIGKIIGILTIIFLVCISVYISFNSRFVMFTADDIPFFGDIYITIYKFFCNIMNKISDFFIGK